MMILGRFDEFQIFNNTIEHATSYALGVANDEGMGGVFPALVNISGNVITQMDQCAGDFCADMEYGVGMIVLYASEVVIENNHLHDWDQAQGIFATYADSVTVRGNLLEDLVGSEGMFLDATKVLVEDNRIVGGTAGPFSGLPPASFRGITGTTTMTGKPMELTMRRNYMADIQGFSTLLLTAHYPNQEATLIARDNESVDCAAGFYYQSDGSLRLEGNRVTGARIGVFLSQSNTVSVSGNVIRDGVNDDFSMPPGDDGLVITDNTVSVALGTVSGEEPIRFNGNHVLGMDALSGGLSGSAVFLGQSTDVEMKGNVLEQNMSGCLLMLSEYDSAVLEGNIFRGVDPVPEEGEVARHALVIGGENLTASTSLTIRGNAFADFMTGGGGSTMGVLFESDEVDLSIVDNLFHNIRAAHVSAVGNAVLQSLEFVGNTGRTALFYVGQSRESLFEDNDLAVAIILLQGQPEDGFYGVRANRFDDSRLEVRMPAGEVSVEGNEFNSSYQVGLVVASAWHAGTGEAYPPDVHVKRNIFNGVREGDWNWGAVGVIADALHITGTSGFPCSGVAVTGNRFHACERNGAILSSAGAAVDGNMFAEGCPLVIQNESGAKVTGADVEFALRPDTPYGVVTIDDMMLME